MNACPACGHPDPHEPRTASLSSGKCPKCLCLRGWRPGIGAKDAPIATDSLRAAAESMTKVVNPELEALASAARKKVAKKRTMTDALELFK